MLDLDEEGQTVRFQGDGTEINFGSIGKGYALDCAASVIRGKIGGALLNAGSSSMLAINDRNSSSAFQKREWILGIRDPRNTSQRLGVIRIGNGALATSGSEEQYFVANGQRYGHIIDPRTGIPANKVQGVTVVTRSAAIADALATAFYIGGADLAQRYCEDHAEVMAIILEVNADTPVVIGNYSDCEVELGSQ